MRASRSGNIWQHVDWITIGMFLLLALFGWLNIYGASYTFDQTSIFDFSNRAGKQFVWLMGSLVLGIILLLRLRRAAAIVISHTFLSPRYQRFYVLDISWSGEFTTG